MLRLFLASSFLALRFVAFFLVVIFHLPTAALIDLIHTDAYNESSSSSESSSK